MRKLFAFILAAISPCICLGEDFSIRDLSCGIYSNASANQIPDNCAAYIQNFYTDIEPIAIEANGFQKIDDSVLGGTSPVSGLWRFVDVTGSEFIIAFSSRTYYKRTSGSEWESFGYLSTTDNRPDAAITLGKIWFTNGIDNVWSFDGTSSVDYSDTPKGRLIEAWRSRLVIGNISGALSTLRFSEDGDGSNFALGGNQADPFSIQIGGANDGYNTTCMAVNNDSLIVGRKFDLWSVDGYDQADVATRNLSSEVGCLDDGTVQVKDGTLIWVSHRGIEAMSTSRPQNISEPIKDISDIFSRNTSNLRYVTQTSASDWASGEFSDTVYLDTVTANGSIRFLWPDEFDSFRDGTASTIDAWLEYNSGGASGDVYATGGTLRFDNAGSSLGGIVARTSYPLPDFQRGTTYHFSIESLPVDTGRLSRCYFSLLPVASTSAINYEFFSTLNLALASTETGKAYLFALNIDSDTATTFPWDDTGFDFPVGVDIYLSTSDYTVSLNDVTVASGTHSAGGGQQYAHVGYLRGTTGAGSMIIDDFGIAPQEFTFTSSSVFVGSGVTSWAPIAIDDQDSNNGTITYQFNSSDTATMSEASWASVLSGAAPSNSTNSYAALRGYFYAPDWDSFVQLNGFTVSWNEGTGFPPMTSHVWDRRYWLSFTTNTESGAYNDLVLVYQRNNTWTTLKGVNAASFVTWLDDLRFGNSSGNGYVYNGDTGNSLDGSSMESFIRFKSYDLGQFFRPKEFKRAYVGYLADPSFTGNFSMKYDIDRYGTLYDMGSVSMGASQGQVAAKFPFPVTNVSSEFRVIGREVQYTLTKTGTGDRLKLYGIGTQFMMKEEE